MQREFNFRTLMVKEDNGRYRVATGDEIIGAAIAEMNRRFARGKELTSPEVSQEFLKVRLGHLPHEVFGVLWLDTRHRVIAFEEMFRGTIDGASVYPREVLRAAIDFNAAACILAHNHPSGVTEPSQADLRMTQQIREALAHIDVRVLDHVIIGDGPACSFAARGLI